MKITVNKCEFCNQIFQNDDLFETHYAKELKKQEFLAKFPTKPDNDCTFANGKYNIPRTAEWVQSFTNAVKELSGDIGYSFKSYGWYRVLSDSQDILYPIALRLTHICPKCHKEWGQAYYANKCC